MNSCRQLTLNQRRVKCLSPLRWVKHPAGRKGSGTIRTSEWISVDELIEQYLAKEANTPGTLELLEKQYEAAGFTNLKRHW